jgi:serine/threonine protein kinase
MFTVAVPPLRPARLTPEDDEPFAFALGAKIGEGAFSTVYALSAPSTSMAAKVYLKEGLAMAVVQEMRVLRTLYHPNIIRMHATHETDEKLSPDQHVERARPILLLLYSATAHSLAVALTPPGCDTNSGRSTDPPRPSDNYTS